MNAEDASPAVAITRWKFEVSRRYQHILDKSTPHVGQRWLGCLVVALVYVLRVYMVQGFYVVSYALGIYILNLLIGFLSPQVDPEILDVDQDNDGKTSKEDWKAFFQRIGDVLLVVRRQASLKARLLRLLGLLRINNMDRIEIRQILLGLL